jgi:hypothetical protein
MPLFGPKESTRVAEALERLVELYEIDLRARGVLNVPNDEQGEVIDTDDAEIALLIQALRERRPDRIGKGLYIGDEEDKWEDGSPVIPEELPTDRESLFGSGWGINVGPEGAEENWSGPDGDGSPGEPDPGDVRGPSGSEEPEG